ncbi:unnamed protein product [Blepharisma stoltei]|uniref:Uncharacterized protein n=1 Tax=Blepharisma stoltei TaxID=1481888 RepID=A0AAU9IVJ5_9CILI|nr:unnamed protein product [Blepharisma stoltei]
MVYYDLYIKWFNDKKQIGQARQTKVHEILGESEYECQALNYSMHSLPYPNTDSIPALKRLTVKVNFSQILNNTELLSQYDIVAARPSNDQDFHYCCMEAEIDIISLKLHDRLGMRIKLNLVQEAIKRGIMFELCYSQALRDINARRVFISNATNIIKATKGRNIIFSSSAKDLYDQRSPWDVINLGCVLGLAIDKAQNSIVKNPEDAISHGQARKVFKSAIQISDKSEFVKQEGWNILPSSL